jgi:hypothetical protein
LADSTNVQRGQNEGYNGKGKSKYNKKRRLDYGSSNDHAQQGSIIQHIGASNGYGQGSRGNHETHCAVLEGTSPPKYDVPKEGVPRAVDYVDPVLNKAPAGGHLTADNHVTDETFDLDDAAYEEYLDQIRKNKERHLANQAAIRALALRMEEEMPGLDPDSDTKEEDNSPEDDADEEMPELDPDSDAEEEDNSSEDDADKESDDEDDSSGQEEEEEIPDLQPEDDGSPSDELARALKEFLDRSKEGELRLTSSDVSIVQADDPRHPSMFQLQRRDNGKEGGYRYISFGTLPINRRES